MLNKYAWESNGTSSPGRCGCMACLRGNVIGSVLAGYVFFVFLDFS